jgi:CO/xanthine dehydrogenase Mo-binding subunit
LYVATQRPFGLRDEAAALLEGHGRGNIADAALEAVRLSRAVERPVLVQWTRAEEFRLSAYRPTLEADVAAVLGQSGRIVGWRYAARTNPHLYGTGESPELMAMTAGRNAVPPYDLGSADVVVRVIPAAVRTAAFRSLAAAPNVFAIESFVDELAHASGQTPMAFRLRHVSDERLRRVLDVVRVRSRWDARPHGGGRGCGVACAIYHGTYVAQVVEVSVAASGRVHIERVWCAVDPGRLVHPDGARNQIEGGIQQAASWTLLEELQHRDGEVVTASWRDYPIATFRDAPREIDVVFTSEPQVPSTGTGEPGAVPTAAAIANAVFDACGARVRQLPVTSTTRD